MNSMNNQLASEGGSGGGAGGASTLQHQANKPISNSLPRIHQTNNNSPSSIQEQNQNQIHIPLPQHFIVRPGVTKHTASGTVTSPGPIVPLVAVDQLPQWLDVAGVPRELSVEQTVGLTNLGTLVRNPEFYTVYMHRNPEAGAAAIPSDNFAAPVPAFQEHGPGRMDRVQQAQMQTLQQRQYHDTRVENKDNGLFIPVSMPAASASSSTPSPEAPMTEEAVSGSHIDPGAASFTSGGHNNDLGNRAGGNSSKAQATNTSDIRTERQMTDNNSSPQQQPPNIASPAIGLHPRLPSPTATGSTPPVSSNPYPILHHYPHHPYPMAPPQSPMHPADRMLQSWYHPLHPYTHHKSTSAPPTRQKSSLGGNSSAAAGGSNTPAGPNPNERTSIYCRHWCHRGTCRWGTQCRYAHAMPATPEGLREVGLTHHPAWWTAAMNIGLAYGSGGFGVGGGGFGLGLGGAWYPARHHGMGGGNKKAQRERDRDRDREREAKEREKEKGKEKESVGKGKSVEDKNGGAGSNSKPEKKDVVEDKAGSVGDQGKGKVEQPQEEQKLVEI
ncbi:hypothetical protein F5Y06DRAFT_304515 [Hypoxylon sp. FL0890]|nr:hypothetical protein F5Y06DRAFT_304515 [Hypoxylon sp. FL0890]